MGRPQTVTHEQKVQNSTSLSTYVWNIKEKDDATPTLKWSILRHARSYSANVRNCPLCFQEKIWNLILPNKDWALKQKKRVDYKMPKHKQIHTLSTILPSSFFSQPILLWYNNNFFFYHHMATVYKHYKARKYKKKLMYNKI